MKININIYSGYIHGALQPTVKVHFLELPIIDANIQYLRLFLESLNLSVENFEFDCAGEDPPSYNTPEILIIALDFLNHNCGDSRFTKIKLLKNDREASFFIPTISPEIVMSNLKSIVELFDKFKNGKAPSLTTDLILHQKKKLSRFLPLGTNNMNFIKAAVSQHIPYKIIDRSHIIYGYGSSSVILNSSLTEHESVTGVSLAKSKVVSNRFLQMSGLPVTRQAQVETLEAAKLIADKFGYPVVLKPEAEEQGRGIFANIIDSLDLELCYNHTKEKYDKMIIEKQIIGDHYRIDFADGSLIKAVRRRPPHVIGDGLKSIDELISALNLDPERLDPNSSKNIVEIDNDLIRCLRNQRITLTDIPTSGRKIYLKSISNLSRGGDQVHVENFIHEENLELCKAISRIFRLKIIGVDIISPDISVPWHQNGAKICEVNAQPQLGRSGTDVYWRVLHKYIRPACQIYVQIKNKYEAKTTYLFDVEKHIIFIELSPKSISENGMPTQYYDYMKFSDDITDQEKKMVESLVQSKKPKHPQV